MEIKLYINTSISAHPPVQHLGSLYSILTIPSTLYRPSYPPLNIDGLCAINSAIFIAILRVGKISQKLCEYCIPDALPTSNDKLHFSGRLHNIESRNEYDGIAYRIGYAAFIILVSEELHLLADLD